MGFREKSRGLLTSTPHPTPTKEMVRPVVTILVHNGNAGEMSPCQYSDLPCIQNVKKDTV